MAEPGEHQRDEWRDVAERFRSLGDRFRSHYDEHAGGTAADGQRLEEALRSVVDAVDKALTAVGDTGRDPGFRADAEQAARTLGVAIAATFDEVGETVRQRFGRSDR